MMSMRNVNYEHSRLQTNLTIVILINAIFDIILKLMHIPIMVDISLVRALAYIGLIAWRGIIIIL